jgi:hypothetical protein
VDLANRQTPTNPQDLFNVATEYNSVQTYYFTSQQNFRDKRRIVTDLRGAGRRAVASRLTAETFAPRTPLELGGAAVISEKASTSGGHRTRLAE